MAAPSSSDSSPIRVMLVDDSAVIRGLIARGLAREPDIEVVATAADGDMAIAGLKRNPADVVLLDVEMPNKDGLAALPELKAIAPKTHVIMVSTLTQRNAEISLKAMKLGAADYMAKPSGGGKDSDALENFYRELTRKVKHLGQAARLQREPNAAASKPKAAPQVVAAPALMPMIRAAEVIAIASSTGGPQALVKLLKAAGSAITKRPVLITQHMPATFTALLAEHITTDTALDCREAVDGEMVEPGRAYMAPGDYHMRVEKKATGVQISLNQDPPVNFCRPAADPMFESIAQCYGKKVMAAVLTGMGNDGCAGVKIVKEAGGQVVIQDKETSVVWGMPGAVAAEGFQDAMVPLEAMAELLQQAAR